MELSEKTVEMLLENLTDQNNNLAQDIKYFRTELEQTKIELQHTLSTMHNIQNNQREFLPVEDFKNLFDPEFVTNKKINTIKTVRAITGMGLKETKDLVEQFLIPFMESVMKNEVKGVALPKAKKIDASLMWEDQQFEYARGPNDNGECLGDILDKALKESNYDD